jgi:hypothetical protein
VMFFRSYIVLPRTMQSRSRPMTIFVSNSRRGVSGHWAKFRFRLNDGFAHGRPKGRGAVKTGARDRFTVSGKGGTYQVKKECPTS